MRHVIAYGKSLVGTPYEWWKGGKPPPGAPMWAANGPPPDRTEITTVNCAGLTNLILRSIGMPIPGAGGTPDYYRTYKDVSESFDISQSYPIGTLVGRKYTGDDEDEQGHVAVLIEDGRVLQACATGASPGVTIDIALTESHDDVGYEYAVRPEHWLGGRRQDHR